MNSRGYSKSLTGITVLMFVVSFLLVNTSPSYAKKWFFGVGTGMTAQNVQGDQGLTTANFGSIQGEVDLDPEEFKDLMQTAFGLGGYATDGTWLLQGTFARFELGGEPSGELPASVGGGTFTADFAFDITLGRFSVGRTVYRSENKKFSFTPYAGVRYLKHELGADYSIVQGSTTTEVKRAVDHSWADVLIGTGIGYALTPKVSFSAGGDAGFGGSEGTFSFNTGLSFKPIKWFSIGPTFSYIAIKYENGAKGEPEWYLYDCNEFGAGVSFLFHF